MELIEVLKNGSIDKFKEIFGKQNQETQLKWLQEPLQNGMNILHICCSQGYIKHVQFLIQTSSKYFSSPAEYLDIPAQGPENDEQSNIEKFKKDTAIFYAIKSGHGGFQEIIQLLIKNGCNINFQDKEGKTPLHYASELGQDDTLELLLSNNANSDIQDNTAGLTPLHVSIQNGQFNSVQILCDIGKADVNIKDTLNSDSLLHYAAIGQGNASLYIKYLVEKQNMSVFVKNKDRLTPRQYAQRKDRFKFHRVIKLLRELENKEQNVNMLIDEDDKKQKMEKEDDKMEKVYDYLNYIVDNLQLSFCISLFVAILLFMIVKTGMFIVQNTLYIKEKQKMQFNQEL